MRNRSFFILLYNYLYQIKKSIKLGKFNLYILIYSINYFSSNRKLKCSHLKEELPWITFQSFDFIRAILKKDFLVYEFGSGGSSLFFAKNVKKIYSIEHDKDWFNQINSQIISKYSELSNLDLKLFEPSMKNDFTVAKSISDKKFFGYDFDNYAKSILKFPDEFFDLIIVDGRARPYCLRNSISKLKIGGFLLFDNSDRIHYQQELNKIKDWLILETYGPTIGDLSFNQTSIYRKPLA